MRQRLEAVATELQGQLDLIEARRGVVHNLVEFSSSSGQLGGLEARIQALARSIALADSEGAGAGTSGGSPAVAASAISAPASAAAASAGAASGSSAALMPPLAPLQATSNSLWDLASRAFALADRRSKVDRLLGEADAFAAATKSMREPFSTALRALSAQGDSLAQQSVAADPAQLAQTRQQFDALTNQFKRISVAMVPLAKQNVLLERYHDGLSSWRDSLQREYSDDTSAFWKRCALLLGVLAAVLALGEIWRQLVVALWRRIRGGAIWRCCCAGS